MIYYGDEAGMEGFEDPLNRGTYPWGREDRDLLAWFTRLGALRNAYPALQSGTISWLYTAGPLLIFARQNGDQRLTTAVNASPDSHTVTLLWEGAGPTDLLTGDTLPCSGGVLHLQRGKNHCDCESKRRRGENNHLCESRRGLDGGRAAHPPV